MAESAVLLNISEMIDLAIGSPEVGVVDFNMLQTVLHCLAQQLRVLGKNVEVRGSLGSLPIPGRDNAQTINIREYAVDTDNKNALVEKPSPPVPAVDDTILVVERVRKGDSPPHTGGRSPTPAASPVTERTPHGARSPEKQPTEKLSLVTISKFNVLESTVDDLKSRVYGSMPKNEDILEEVRSQTNIKAITDMWTNLNVSSRLEAAEAGVAKLSSLVQDLINESTELQEAVKRHPESKTQVSGGLSATNAVANDVAATNQNLAIVQDLVNHLRVDLDDLTETVYTMKDEAEALSAAATEVAVETKTGGAAKPDPKPEPKPDPKPEVSEPPVTPLAGRTSKRFTSAGSGGALAEKLNDLEKRLKECCDSAHNSTVLLEDQMSSLQDQVDYLVKQAAASSGGGSLSPDLMKDLQGLMELFQTVQGMQDQLKKVHETALQLAAEKEDRQSHINALLEQIELLKNIKLDREDMVVAMAEKADLRMLARKVSQDQFEMACDDLSRGLEHALGKLNMQEALWQQALDDIQREIETKLDKLELSPVKDFFNNKLKQLQQNLKQMASLRREAEAAGTKRKLLRDVNCISCDAQATMQMEAESSLPMSKPLPATMSMKPYLSYELDSIRKAQASNVPQRNMHDWENIDKQMAAQPKQPQKVRSEADKHMCNRYCGGSHTTTTPAQRVARLGHFIKQWGPDVLPLSSGYIAGGDGRLYKTSAGEAEGTQVDTKSPPKPVPRKAESPKSLPSEKPEIVAECKCLEAAGRNTK